MLCIGCDRDFLKRRKNQTYCQPSCQVGSWQRRNKNRYHDNKLNWQKKYRKTPYGLITMIVSHQIMSSKMRGHPMPEWTTKEFYTHAINNPVFLKLFSDWHNSGYERNLSPSVDRIKSNKPYTWDNIQFVTTHYNCYVKGNKEKKRGNVCVSN